MTSATSFAPRKPVRSATAVTALRALSAREPREAVRNPDHLAERFLGPLERLVVALPPALTRRVVESISPGSYAYFLARTRFIDGCLLEALEAGSEQLVILGAGYDSRAHRFERALRGVAVFEVDLPEIQAAKRNRLRALSAEPRANLRYVALDFDVNGLEAALEEAGFDPDRRSLFIWEGVSYFLEARAVRDVLDFVGRRTRRGSAIAFDYALASFVAGDHGTYGGAQIARWIERHDEPFRFGLDPNETASFLRERGLALLADLGPEEIRAAFLTPPDGRPVGEPLGHLRLARARVIGAQRC